MPFSFSLTPTATTPGPFTHSDFNALITALTASVAAYPMAPIPTPASLGLYPNKAAGQKMTSSEFNNIVTVLAGVATAANNASTSNILPVVNAGNDLTIQLPTSQAALGGSATDPDGTIAGNVWSQASGPATATFVSTSTLSTTVSGLTVAGTYQFDLVATDNRGGSTADRVQVTVLPAATGTTTATKDLLLYVGDSIVAGSTGEGDPGPGVTAHLETRLGLGSIANLDILNFGFSGKSYQWIIDNKLSTILAAIDLAKYKQVYILLAAGANDFTTQFASLGYSCTVAGVFAAARSLAQSLKGKAPAITKLAICSVMNRKDSQATDTFDTDRTAFNNKLLTADNDFADHVVPATEQRKMYLTNSPDDAAYFPDKVHPSGAKGAPILAEVWGKYVLRLMGLPAMSNPAYRLDIDYSPPTTVTQVGPESLAWQYSQLVAIGSAELLGTGTVRQTAGDDNFASGAAGLTKFRAQSGQNFIGQYRFTCPLKKVHVLGIAAFSDIARPAGQGDVSLRAYPEPTNRNQVWQNTSAGRVTRLDTTGVAAGDQHYFTSYVDSYVYLLSTGATITIARDPADTKEYYPACFFGNTDSGDNIMIEQRGLNPVAWNA